MARGDFTLFNEALVSIHESKINLETDTIKIGIIDNVVTPTAAAATPAWGVTSDEDYDANEVSTAGGYTAGGETMANPVFSRTGAVGKFDTDPVTISQNASGFTDGYWGIVFSETAANNEAIGFVDLGGPVSEVAGDITITPNASGWFTSTIT